MGHNYIGHNYIGHNYIVRVLPLVVLEEEESGEALVGKRPAGLGLALQI